jgi:t-SNARE complex subunit (syntaxin)
MTDLTKLSLDQLKARAVAAVNKGDRKAIAALLLEAKRRAESRGIETVKTERHAELYKIAEERLKKG